MSALEGERVVHAACGKWYTAAITGVCVCVCVCVCGNPTNALTIRLVWFGLGLGGAFHRARASFVAVTFLLKEALQLDCAAAVRSAVIHKLWALTPRSSRSGNIALGRVVVGFQGEGSLMRRGAGRATFGDTMMPDSKTP